MYFLCKHLFAEKFIDQNKSEKYFLSLMKLNWCRWLKYVIIFTALLNRMWLAIHSLRLYDMYSWCCVSCDRYVKAAGCYNCCVQINCFANEPTVMLIIRVIFSLSLVISYTFAQYSGYKREWIEFKVNHTISTFE